MAKPFKWVLAAMTLGGAMLGGGAVAQPAPAAAPTTTVPKPPTYVLVQPLEILRRPAEFDKLYVQIPDFFGRTLDRFPNTVVRMGFSPQAYYGFRTDRAMGSNMICFIARDNPDAEAFFGAPLDQGSNIYIVGRIGAMVDTGEDVVPVCTVDRLVRGHTAPPMRVVQRKKPIVFTMERLQNGQYVKVQEYEVPEPGKRYAFPDPYDPSKKIYMTFRY